MKKTIKSLVIAASVAAIAGIGAVSFAKWEQGTTTDEKLEDIPTGSIVVMGELSASHDLGSKKLVPHDQEDQFDENTMAKEMTIELEYDGDEGATITMTVEGDVASKIEWYNGSAWEAIGEGQEVEEGEIRIRLNSNDKGDMNKTFTITFSAAAPTVED